MYFMTLISMHGKSMLSPSSFALVVKTLKATSPGQSLRILLQLVAYAEA
jgi:hypothetical protein